MMSVLTFEMYTNNVQGHLGKTKDWIITYPQGEKTYWQYSQRNKEIVSETSLEYALNNVQTTFSWPQTVNLKSSLGD